MPAVSARLVVRGRLYVAAFVAISRRLTPPRRLIASVVTQALAPLPPPTKTYCSLVFFSVLGSGPLRGTSTPSSDRLIGSGSFGRKGIILLAPGVPRLTSLLPFKTRKSKRGY